MVARFCSGSRDEIPLESASGAVGVVGVAGAGLPLAWMPRPGSREPSSTLTCSSVGILRFSPRAQHLEKAPWLSAGL